MEVDIKPADRLHHVAKLASADRYRSVMSRVATSLASDEQTTIQVDSRNADVSMGHDGSGAGIPFSNGQQVNADDDYELLVECNKLAVDIDNEIVAVFNFLKERYRPKFPELESLVQNPLDYARVVEAIGNEMDITNIDLEKILPPATVMVVTVTATTTSGQPLNKGALDEVLEGCALLQQLDRDKLSILDLVKRRMDRIAPNLSAAVGTEIAAQLMGIAGGLISLAQIPACNVLVLGAKRKTLTGFSSKTVQPHQGFIYASDLVQNTPPALRSKAARLVAAKCTLLARVDAHGNDRTGATGRAMRADMEKKIEKWQEPPPARKGEVLPVPDAGEMKKRRRGGRRYRKMKEKYGMTELKKQANRMKFNEAEEEVIDGEETLGLGTIGKEGAGRLRAVAAEQRQKLSSKAAKKYGVGAGNSTKYGASTVISGLSSSLAFTPIQGIELANPNAENAAQVQNRGGTESYFSEYSGFRSSKTIAKRN